MLQWLMLGLFVAILLGSGYVAMRKTKTVNDFFLGNRNVGPWMSAFAFGTTYFSAVLFIGYAGKVGWGFGLSALWIAVGNALIGSLLAWWILAKRTRRMTVRLNARTMPEFLEARYGSKNLKMYSAIIIFVFLVPYSASVYMGLSYLFQEVLGMEYLVANLLMAGLTALFLVMGGYLAVAITDFIQGIVMLFGVAMMLFFVFNHEKVGGISEAITRLNEINPALASPAPMTLPAIIALISLVLLTSLGTWGLPQMVQKFYSIKDEASIGRATWVSTVFCIIIGAGAYGIGALSPLFFEQIPLLDGRPNPDLIIPQILTETLPLFGLTVILLLVLSASMSSLASLVLVSASAIAIDFVGIVKPQWGKEYGVFMMRALCIIFVALSLIIAIAKPAIILDLMAISWGTVAGTFLAPYLYGLFWRKTTKAGAWAGALTGLTISVGLSFIAPLVGFTEVAGIKLETPLVGTLAMLISLVVVPVVSIFTAPLSAEKVDQAFGTDEQGKSKYKQQAIGEEMST
ncbi:sodium/solute symporter [Heliorestis acidaminivorans]|uniref:Sodium/solute symporter n=1 Tax=Heliorestis acidaminivorans TaxID=553427 RepID=A0A6I0EXH8_9FIRM|nr:sodium/solute symporter [Heliorestis acidaminivorans]KAB2951194.1 sodium/solute symporter [Heliorestis acidaminivorans]